MTQPVSVFHPCASISVRPRHCHWGVYVQCRMIHVQTYYLTAVLALILSGISLLVSLVSLAVSERHRKAERADKQASREADLAYKYSKEVQRVLIEVEKYKRQKCDDSTELYYNRLKKLEFEDDWAIKEKMTIANGFWRETIYLWNKGKLPHEFFEKDNIWLHRGNMYRLLLEPADIANHYGSKAFAGAGHYLEGNRAGRYQFLEDLWARRKKKKPISSISFALMEQQADPLGHRHDASHDAVMSSRSSLEVQAHPKLQYRAAKQYSELQEV